MKITVGANGGNPIFAAVVVDGYGLSAKRTAQLLHSWVTESSEKACHIGMMFQIQGYHFLSILYKVGNVVIRRKICYNVRRREAETWFQSIIFCK